MEFRRLEGEHGDGDWHRKGWGTRVLLTDSAEAAAVRAAVQDTVPRAYRRAVNGDLRGGPIITCSGDQLGGTVSAGVEIGEQQTEVTRWTPLEYHWTLPLTLREA